MQSLKSIDIFSDRIYYHVLLQKEISLNFIFIFNIYLPDVEQS